MDKTLLLVDRNLELINPKDAISQFALPSSEWNLQEWHRFLPPNAIQTLKVIKAPCNAQQDLLWWRAASDGRFSVKSAYTFITSWTGRSVDPVLGKIKHWQVHKGVELFNWETVHERLTTNSIRAKRGFSNTNECPFECHCEESVIHLLRDCEQVKLVWKALINPNHIFAFFSFDL